MKFGTEEYTIGPHLRAKFGSDRGWGGYSSPKIWKFDKNRGFRRFPEDSHLIPTPFSPLPLFPSHPSHFPVLPFPFHPLLPFRRSSSLLSHFPYLPFPVRTHRSPSLPSHFPFSRHSSWGGGKFVLPTLRRLGSLLRFSSLFCLSFGDE